MIHRFSLLLLVVWSLSLCGCATMFSGSSQKIKITANPSDSTIIVLGGTAGAIVAKVGKISEIQKRILSILKPHLNAEDQKFIASIGVERFITNLILQVKTGRLPEGATEQLAATYNKIPAPIKEKIISKIGLESFGVGDVEPRLKRGQIYAVVGWRTGADIKIKTVDSTFNWATLWNVFNLGLGVPVDMFTGAWMKLTPEKVELAMPATAENMTPSTWRTALTPY